MAEQEKAQAKRKKRGSQAYLEVTLDSATNLISYDSFSSASDPFVKVSLKNDEEKMEDAKKTYTSSVANKTLNPEWDETFLFKHDKETQLVLELFDHNRFGDHDLMTTLVIPVSEIPSEEQEDPKEFTLIDTKKKKDLGSKLFLILERHLNIKQMKSRAKRMREDKEQAEEKAANLETEKQGLIKQIETLGGEVDKLTTNLKQKTENLEETTARAEKAESDLAVATNGETEKLLNSEIDTLKFANEELEGAREEVKNEIDTLKSENSELKSKIDALNTKLEEQENSQRVVEEKPETSEETSEKLYNSNDSDELGSLRSENEILKHRVTQLSGELEKWIAGEQKTDEQGDGRQAEIDKLMKNIRVLTEAKQSLEKQLAEGGNVPQKSSKLRWILGSVIVLLHVLVITVYFVKRKRSATT